MAELLPPPPVDVMFEILLRLPVKTVVRFRSVSKGWRDLIDSSNFAKSHFNRPSNDPPSLLVFRYLPNSNAYNAYDVVDLSSVINGGPALAFNEHQIHPQSGYYEGQCNGLVCISNRRGAFLWNPATGKQFAFDLPTQGRNFQHWGFGYDKYSDDYKIAAVDVAAEGKEADDDCYSVWIYSLRSRSWERIDDFPYYFVGEDYSGVFANAALHWKVWEQESEEFAIGALDLGKLEYNLVPLPDYNPENTVDNFEYLGVLDGRLCAVYYDSNYEDLDMWMMKEYGVKESWSKLIRCANYTMGLISSAYLHNDEVLLFTPYYDEGFGCEFRTISFGGGHEIKMRSSGRLPGGYWPYVYVPSLVCPQNAQEQVPGRLSLSKLVL